VETAINDRGGEEKEGALVMTYIAKMLVLESSRVRLGVQIMLIRRLPRDQTHTAMPWGKGRSQPG